MNNNNGRKMNKFISLNEIDSLLSSKLYNPGSTSSSYKRKNACTLFDDNDRHHRIDSSTKDKIDSILSSKPNSHYQAGKLTEVATAKARDRKTITKSNGLRQESDAVINAVNSTVGKSYRISTTKIFSKSGAVSTLPRKSNNNNYSKNKPIIYRLPLSGRDRRGEEDDADGMEKPSIPRRRRSLKRMESLCKMSNQMSKGMNSPPLTKMKPEASISSVSTVSTASSSCLSSENSSCFSSLSLSSQSSYYDDMENISQEFRRILSNISTDTVHFMEEENSDEEDNCTMNTNILSSCRMYYDNDEESDSDTETVVTTNSRSEMFIRKLEATTKSNNMRFSSLCPRS